MTLAVIVGAGIGGLTTALALRARGFDVVVLEQASRIEARGAGIQLSPNANRVLDRLGVLSAVAAASVEPESLEIVEGRGGRRLLSVPLAPGMQTRYGQPYLNTHRGDLQEALLNAVRAAMPDAVHTASRVTRVQDCPEGVVIDVADGSRITADLVIGADGVHSQVRDHVLSSRQSARFTGHVAYFMLVPRSAIPDSLIPPPRVRLWLGPHGHVVSYWVRSGELYNIVAIVEDSDWRADAWTTTAEVSQAVEAYRGWHPSLRGLIATGIDVQKLALLDRAVPDQWSRGRVALLGDACHAMRPYAAQGSAMAIEDAWVQAECLAADDDIVRALTAYSKARVERLRRLHSTVARNAKTFHFSSWLTRFGRDTALRALAGKPSRWVDQMDWLFGFDVTRST